jgi:hypothetical protein
MMMVAPYEVGGPLMSPESSPLESRSFARSGKQILLWPDLLQGVNIYLFIYSQNNQNNQALYGTLHKYMVLAKPMHLAGMHEKKIQDPAQVS